MCDRSDRDRASSAALLQLGSLFTGRYDACIYPDTGTFPIPHPGARLAIALIASALTRAAILLLVSRFIGRHGACAHLHTGTLLIPSPLAI
ncbi:hypothetical protein NDU88_000725 [Pleurodeles waltl]|uniref:Uncharacterized protein n=1 Tax=Pleurodeles waltl TaxID=8319 RepID=A0AAV7S814_PLEWA|nr:hypothetical protein NDU88_000725 [Pleurodeles waltl]